MRECSVYADTPRRIRSKPLYRVQITTSRDISSIIIIIICIIIIILIIIIISNITPSLGYNLLAPRDIQSPQKMIRIVFKLCI